MTPSGRPIAIRRLARPAIVVIVAMVSLVAVPAAHAVTPTLTTTASASTTVGGGVFDTATLAGGSNPTGTITFRLFAPADPGCIGPEVFLSSKMVAGNGNYISDSFTPLVTGTYRFKAQYSGDANNDAVSTACNDPSEAVTVTKRQPTLSGRAVPAAATIGSPFADTVTLQGTNPTGNISFTAFGPGDATCSLTPLFTSNAPVTGSGVYASIPYTATVVGTYRFVAQYSGDANHLIASSACGDPMQSVLVSNRPPPPPPPLPDVVLFSTSPKTLRVSKSGKFTYKFVATPLRSGKIDLKSSKKVKVGSKKRFVKLAAKSFTVPATAAVKVKFKLSKSGLKALKKAGKVKFAVNAVLGGKTFTTTLKLKAPKKS